MWLAQQLPTWVALAVSFSACPTEPSPLKEWTLLLPQRPLDLRGSSCPQVELNSLAQLHLWSHKALLLYYSFSCICRSLIPFLCTGSMLMDLFSPHCIYVLAKWLLSLCVFKFMPMEMLWFSCCLTLQTQHCFKAHPYCSVCIYSLLAAA